MRRSSAAAATDGGASSAAASCAAGGGSMPSFEACHEALAKPELFRVILGVLGKGHFCFVARVSKQWKARYAALYPAAVTAYSSVVGSVECMTWATSQQGLELSVGLFKAAARHGDVEVCKALHGKDCPWDEWVCSETRHNRRNGLSVLKWLRSEDLPDKEQCPWYGNGSSVSGEAAWEGHLEMLKWLLSEDGNAAFEAASWDDACLGGHIPVVAWLLEHPPTRALLEENAGGDWRGGASIAAAEGRLEVLQFLHANARHLCDWDADICCRAVMEGMSLAVLKWLRSEEVQCAWGERSCPQVIRDRVYEEEYGGGAEWGIDDQTFEDIKQWVHANGHPCNCQD